MRFKIITRGEIGADMNFRGYDCLSCFCYTRESDEKLSLQMLHECHESSCNFYAFQIMTPREIRVECKFYVIDNFLLQVVGESLIFLSLFWDTKKTFQQS